MSEMEPDIQELIERVTRQYRVAQESAASELRETSEKLLAEHREAQVKGEWTTAKDIRVALQRAEERADGAARRAREDHEGLLGVLQERAQRRQAELNEDPEELVSNDMMSLFDDSDNVACDESCLNDLACDLCVECPVESCTVELSDDKEREYFESERLLKGNVSASEYEFIECELFLNANGSSCEASANVDLFCGEQINDFSIEPVLTEPRVNEDRMEDRESVQSELLYASDNNYDVKPEVDHILWRERRFDS